MQCVDREILFDWKTAHIYRLNCDGVITEPSQGNLEHCTVHQVNLYFTFFSSWVVPETNLAQ